MRKLTLLKVLVVLMLCVVGLGFYQGWIVLSSQRDSGETNAVDVNLKLDADKVKEDAKAVEARVRDLTDTAAGETPRGPSEESVESKD
jgi:hypothetical protein